MNIPVHIGRGGYDTPTPVVSPLIEQEFRRKNQHVGRYKTQWHVRSIGDLRGQGNEPKVGVWFLAHTAAKNSCRDQIQARKKDASNDSKMTLNDIHFV